MTHYFMMSGIKISLMEKSENVESYNKYINSDNGQPEVLFANADIDLMAVKFDSSSYANLIIKTKNNSSAARFFETLKLFFGYYEGYYDEEMDLVKFSNLSNKEHVKVDDFIVEYKNFNEHTQFKFVKGLIKGNIEVRELAMYLELIYNDARLRKALASHYEAQRSYYTHLIGSYISSHSRPEIQMMDTEEYKFLNMIHQEKLCSSLTASYRGIEAIMDHNFRDRSFQNEHYKKVIDGKIPSITWDTNHLRAFYRVRYAPLNKLAFSRVSTMIKLFLAARNRAGHGKVYSDQKKNNAITIELTHECTYFLTYLISEYMKSKLPM